MKCLSKSFIVLLILATLLIFSTISDAQYKRQTKGPWYGVFTHIGETNPFKKWKGFGSLKSRIEEIKRENPYISGVTIKILWKHINPAKNEYNFKGLDELLRSLEQNDMRVILSMFTGNQSAPDWIYEEGAKKFVASNKVKGRYLYGPVPWDPVYMKFLNACLKELAKKINSDPRVVAVGIYGHNFVGGEMVMAYANTEEDLRKWDALGRTDTVIFENWKHWVDVYADFFSNKKIVLTLGPMYGEGKRIGHLTDQLAQYAVDKYSDGVILQHMALHGRFDGLGICWEHGNLDKCADSQIRNRDKVSSGFETLGSFIKQPARQGNVEMTVYNALKANPLYIQLWPRDALSPRGPEIAQQINGFYEKYKSMKLENIRTQLQKQGKYLQNYRWKRDIDTTSVSTHEKEEIRPPTRSSQPQNTMVRLRSVLSRLDLTREQKQQIREVIQNAHHERETGNFSITNLEEYVDQIRAILTAKERREFDRLFSY